MISDKPAYMLSRLQPYSAQFYFVFRVLVGLLFLQHGLQKVFGMFGGIGGGSLISGGLPPLMILAGIIEFAGGLAIIFGLFARPAALIAALEMIVAYFIVHAPQGPVPLLNQGELVILYVAAFMVILAQGAGKLSLEKALFKKELA